MPASSPTAAWSPSAPIDELGGADARVPIVRWVENGTAREQRTDQPGDFVARLARGGEPERLEVIRPALEDIYLTLVDAERTAQEVSA